MPHTAAQAEASRRNGARGQGPTTPEGKARAAQNARSHGLRSARLCLSSQDDRAAFELTHAALAARFAPVDAAEAMLVARMATALHRAERADLLEAHFWDHRPYGVEHNAPQRMAKVMCTRSDGPRNLATVQRYQVEAGNAFTRALKALDLLRKHQPPADAAANQNRQDQLDTNEPEHREAALPIDTNEPEEAAPDLRSAPAEPAMADPRIKPELGEVEFQRQVLAALDGGKALPRLPDGWRRPKQD